MSKYRPSPNNIYGDAFVNGNLYVDGSISYSGSIAFYGSSIFDPPISASNGDLYYNTSINMLMVYDSYRTKWLSAEALKYDFGRQGATAPGSYFKNSNNIAFTSNRGYIAPFNGTIVSINYFQESLIILEIVINGTIISEISSSNIDMLSVDFNKGDIIGFKNNSSGSVAINVFGSARVKWRA